MKVIKYEHKTPSNQNKIIMNTPSTITQIANYANAGYPIIYIQTHEDQRIEGDIITASSKVRGEPFGIYTWTCTAGLVHHQKNGKSEVYSSTEDIFTALDKYYSDDLKSDRSVLIVYGLHLMMAEPNLVLFQKLKDCALIGKSSNRMMIIIAPVIKIPIELEKLITVIEYKLPTREELLAVAKSVCDGVNHKIDKSSVDAVLDAASGLTIHEAENAFALSLIEAGDLSPAVINREKAATIKKNGLLEIIHTDVGLDEVGGSEDAKTWLTKRRNAFSKEARKYGLPMPKGFLQVGIPGCLRGDVPIYDPVDGSIATVKERFESGKRFNVISKTESGRIVVGSALPPVKYNPAPMLTFNFSNGKSMTVTGDHKFWTLAGWLKASELYDRFLASGSFPLPTHFSFYQPGLREGDLHLIGKAQGCLDGCSEGFRPYDAQPQKDQGTYQSSPPLPVYEPPHNQRDYHSQTRHEDDPLTVYTSILCASQPRPSKRGSCAQDDLPSRRSSEATSLLSIEKSQLAPQSLAGKAQPDTIHEQGRVALESTSSTSVSCGDYKGYTWVSAIKKVDEENYYDFHVLIHNNYWACGVFNHNCGKSLLAKATASILGVPLLKLDSGKLFGSLVGQSEANIRNAIDTAEAIAPCVVWVDELEKAFAGSKSSGSTDGGTAARVFGTFLQWMNDKTAPVFVVATANDISQLPPEMLRKGRFDEIFFVDLPSEEERRQIWSIQIKRHGRKPENFDLSDLANVTDRWTGAEIEALFKEALFAAYEDGKEPTTKLLKELSQHVVPLSQMMSQQIDGMREWAKGRARFASTRKTADVQTVGRKLA